VIAVKFPTNISQLEVLLVVVPALERDDVVSAADVDELTQSNGRISRYCFMIQRRSRSWTSLSVRRWSERFDDGRSQVAAFVKHAGRHRVEVFELGMKEIQMH
jgi:hypothetical protein